MYRLAVLNGYDIHPPKPPLFDPAFRRVGAGAWYRPSVRYDRAKWPIVPAVAVGFAGV